MRWKQPYSGGAVLLLGIVIVKAAMFVFLAVTYLGVDLMTFGGEKPLGEDKRGTVFLIGIVAGFVCWGCAKLLRRIWGQGARLFS